MGVEITTAAADFQADDEGSIPFTRSNVFNDLRHDRQVILTSGLLLILTNDRRFVRCPFARRAACGRRLRPVS